MDSAYRLPREVVPRQYRLVLEPDIEHARFSGTVVIEAEVNEATDRVVLNALELDVDWAVVTAGDTVHRNPGIESDPDAERLTLALDQALPRGPVVIEIAFRGVLNDRLRGFYRSTYADEDGTEHTIATTQFQSTDARRAFPCWDEPDLKATFAITLVVDPEHLAVSNAAEVGREDTPDGRIAVHFADTMPMSTYLVAFVVGPLEATDALPTAGTTVRIIHRPGRGHLSAFALDVAAAALEYYVDYYDLPYPGDKLDMVAIPDFAFGAMENLGCVTYREVLLLVDPDEATQSELQRVADVINHELAHMWFGDLVTMRWWNGIWLNEAFATFMEIKATDAFRPEWDRWTDFGLSRSLAFDVDSLQATRPVEYPVLSPADAEGMFDLLTYEKGAAVVRMLEQFLGEDTFRDGVRHYLRTHQLANTDTDDLWHALEHASDIDVASIMHDWIFQGGYPLLRYDRVDHAGIVVSQTRFGFGDVPPGRWQIPVGAQTDAGLTQALLTDEDLHLTIADDLPRLNVDGSGFYRVAPDAEAIAAAARGAAQSLPAVERYGLIDDTWALVLADHLPITAFLELLGGLGDEDELAVWQRAAGGLGTLSHVCPDDLLPSLEARVRATFDPLAARWGRQARDGESDRQRQLRALALTTLGRLGADIEVRAWARQVHDDATDPELATAAVAIIAADGNRADFDDFWDRYRSAADPQSEQRYLDALAVIDDPSCVQALTDAAVTDGIRTQDAPYVLGRALTNRTTGPMVWEYLTANWSTVIDRFPSNSIARLLGGIRALSQPSVAPGVRRFLTDHPVVQGEKMVEQHLERLDVNVALRERAPSELAAALR